MKLLNSLFAGAVVLLVGATLNAQDATIRIHDAGAGETIPAAIYGQFSEHLGRCIYGGLWVGEDSSVPNVNGYRKDVFEVLTSADARDYNDFDKPETVKPVEFKNYKLIKNGLELTLPLRSVVVMTQSSLTKISCTGEL